MAVENESDQQDKQRNEAEEEAGFNSAFSDESPVVKTADENTEADNTTDDAEGESDEEESLEAEAQEDEGVEATESDEQQAEEDRAHLEKLLGSIPKLDENAQLNATQIRQLQGKMGEINRLVQDLKNNPAGSVAPVKIDKAAFKKLGEEFPEIAEMLAEDLAGISLQTTKGEQTDYAPIVDAKVAQAREEMQQQMEVRLLSMQHRDWRDVVKSDGFKNWVGKLPQEDQEKLNTTWEADYIGDKIAEFKQLTKQKETTRDNRNKRLSRGLMLKGSNRPPAKGLMTEEEGFNAAFQ